MSVFPSLAVFIYVTAYAAVKTAYSYVQWQARGVVLLSEVYGIFANKGYHNNKSHFWHQWVTLIELLLKGTNVSMKGLSSKTNNVIGIQKCYWKKTF